MQISLKLFTENEEVNDIDKDKDFGKLANQ